MTTPDSCVFAFTPDVITAFTEGDCWELARQINMIAGHTIVTASSSTSDAWYHAANMLPDGRIVDIEGIWSEAVWLKKWQGEASYEMDGLFAATWTHKEFLHEIADCGFDPMFNEFEKAKDHAESVLANVENDAVITHLDGKRAKKVPARNAVANRRICITA